MKKKRGLSFADLKAKAPASEVEKPRERTWEISKAYAFVTGYESQAEKPEDSLVAKDSSIESSPGQNGHLETRKGAQNSASLSPTADMDNSESEPLKKKEPRQQKLPTQYRHSDREQQALNTDTMPTHSEVRGTKASGHSTDTVPTQYRHNNSSDAMDSTGTIPTQHIAPNYEDHCVNEIDPTQNRHKNSNDDRSNADTIPTQKVSALDSSKLDPKTIDPTQNRHKNDNGDLPSADTIPTHKFLDAFKFVPKEKKGGHPEVGSTDTMPAQYHHSSDTIPAQSRGIPDTESIQSQHRTGTIPTPIPTQIGSIVSQNTDTSFGPSRDLESKYLLLRGLKLELMNYCLSQCVKNHLNSIRTTYPALAQSTGVAEGSIRTTAKRLRSDGLIMLSAPLKGPGAFIEIILPGEMIRVFARSMIETGKNTDTKILQNQEKNRHNTDTHSDTTPSSKLVSNLNNTNSLTSEQDFFDEIDISRLEHLRISKKHLQDIRNQKLNLTFSQLQGFVDRFAEYASNRENIRNITNPPGFFIKMVQNFSKGEDPLMGIKTDEDRHLEELLENARKASDERKKLKQELLELRFAEWQAGLSDEEKRRVAPNYSLANGQAAKMALLRHAFEEMEEGLES